MVILLEDRWDPKWDERFSQEGFFYGKEPNDFLKEYAHFLKAGGRVLCLAEGEGRNAVFLAKNGFDVTAMDGSAAGFKKLELLKKEQGVRVKTEIADLLDFSIGESQWDAIVAIWCHLPKPIWKIVVKRIKQGLKPGGIFLLEGYTPEQLKCGTGGPPTSDWMFTLKELKEAFSDFTFLFEKELIREIHEGKAHNGLSAVVQFIASR